mmetsp:Transcript_33846/g.79107  ORF Transcript_33846/g.79107 Transcript_33846/m.79107 type:complete len:355 (-) Transcript_33846:54-1118(-)
MVIDVFKSLRKDAKARQKKEEKEEPRAAAAPQQPRPKFEASHKFLVSSNWKSLLERRPDIAPKQAEITKKVALPTDGVADTVVALDCEMVGTGSGGKESSLARVSIVDHEGRVLIDRFVKPDKPVVDYRTDITGITKETLQKPGVLSEASARRKSKELLDGKIVVGHSVHFDFEALHLTHPHHLIRDTSLYRPLRPDKAESRMPSLKKLCSYWLNESIRDQGNHDSVEDARMALRLYRLKSRLWEKQLRAAMKTSEGAGAAGAEDAKAATGAAADDGEPLDAATEGLPLSRHGRRFKRRVRRGALAGIPTQIAPASSGKRGKKRVAQATVAEETTAPAKRASKKRRTKGKAAGV